MARKRYRSQHRKRDLKYIIPSLKPVRLLPSPVKVFRVPRHMDLISDNRVARNPFRVPVYHLLDGTPVRPKYKAVGPASAMQVKGYFPSRLNRAIVCARRQIRKEVLFANGKGGAAHKRKYRRSSTSQIGCR